MTKILTTELYRKYKKILPNNVAIECDIGWYGIIDGLLASILTHIKTCNPGLHLNVVSIKEKFGLLRVCVHEDKPDSRIAGMIRLAETLSGSVCEICGSWDGKVKEVGKCRKTICDYCYTSKKG